MRYKTAIKGVILLSCTLAAAVGAFPQTPEQSGQVMTLQPEGQFELFKKVLGYERNWKSRVGADLTIGVLFQNGYQLSAWTYEDLARTAAGDAGMSVEGVPIRVVGIDLDGTGDVSARIAEENVDFLYFAPLSPAAERAKLKGLIETCNRKRLPTLTGTLSYVDLGVALGFGLESGRRRIAVNVRASRAQGLDLSSQLLKHAWIR
jgi:hypothetical protein